MVAKIQFIILFIYFQTLFVHAQTDTARLKEYLRTLTNTEGFRTYKDTLTLNKAADFIHAQFIRYADTVFEQPFKVNGVTYKNIIASFETHNRQHIIVGAHYDVCGNQSGADDNGSGIAGLLEIARLLRGKHLDKRIDVVAFTLEEPPFFKTQQMGSFQYARSLYEAQIPVMGMVSFDMIGYFDDTKGSQSYPLSFLSWFYGSRGNFITLAKRYKKGSFVRKFSKHFQQAAQIKTVDFAAPAWLPITDRSDHRCFWQFGYSALLITDTALWRNHAYHKTTDTIEKLNFEKMAAVVEATYKALIAVCNE